MPSLQPSLERAANILQMCRSHQIVWWAHALHVCLHYTVLTSPLRGISSMSVEAPSHRLAEIPQSNFNDKARVYKHVVDVQENWSQESAIIAHVKIGEFKLALTLYHELPDLNSHRHIGSVFVALLNACTMLKDFKCGQELHAEIARSGLLGDMFVGSSLVDMYAKCGPIAKAQEVLGTLPVRNVVSWTALISGYVEHALVKEALHCIECMRLEGISLNAHTLVCSLKACGTIGDTCKGRQMHAEIVEKGLLETNVFVGSALVDMYAKCGSLTEAQQVFDKLLVRNVVSWNTLIAAFVEQDRGEEALWYFEQMLHMGVVLSVVTFVSSLKACSSVRSLDKGRMIHSEIVIKGLEGEFTINNVLVDVYGKCGALVEAQDVFNKLTVRDVVSWTALIAGYAEHGHNNEAFHFLECVPHEGISLNDVAYVCSLKACASIGATAKGRELHAEIAKKGLEAESFVGSTLIYMYARSGSLEDAKCVFDKLSNHTIVSWNALVAGYADHGREMEAHNLFEEMQNEGMAPDIVTVVCILKSCGRTAQIHTEIVRKGLERDALVSNVLVDMYAKHGWLAEAHEMLNKLPERGIVAWTALMAGLIEHGHGKEALDCLERIHQEGIALNAVTYVCSLKACGTLGDKILGQKVHAETTRKGLENELLVGSTLIDMYCGCGMLAEGRKVFHNISVRDVVLWNALITGYADEGHGEEVFSLLKDMQDKGMAPDIVTLVCSLKVCGSIGAMEKGQEIHINIVNKGLERELFLGNGLVDMYTKCDHLAEAQVVFDRLTVRDLVSWNTLITGYVEHGHADEALQSYVQMQDEGISLNSITFVCTLKACASMGSLDSGQELHTEISKRGLENESILSCVLVDMYATCGLLMEAQVIFDELFHAELSLWNALIAGYAQLGVSTQVFHILERMIEQGVQPNSVTFVSVLSACSHIGLVDEGLVYFEAMCNDSRLIPTLEHYNCVIDLLGRAGQIDKLVLMIEMMPFHPGIVGWLTMLGACRKWANVDFGKHAFEHVVQVDNEITTAYVCMFNIFADAAGHSLSSMNRKGIMKSKNRS